MGFLKLCVWLMVEECLSKFFGVCGELNKCRVLRDGGDSGGVIGLLILFFIGDLLDNEFLKGFEKLRFYFLFENFSDIGFISFDKFLFI